MSQCVVFKILPSGYRQLHTEFANGWLGQYLLWELLQPLLAPPKARISDAVFERMEGAFKNHAVDLRLRIAMAASHWRSWIHRDHLAPVASAFDFVTKGVERPGHLPAIAQSLRDILEDKGAAGAHIYWYSGNDDFAVRYEDEERIDCNFLDPASLALHGIIEIYEQLPREP